MSSETASSAQLGSAPIGNFAHCSLGSQIQYASVAHLAAIQYVPLEPHIRGRLENSLHQARTHAEWFSHSKCSECM